jgi:hypothetical protein
LANKSAKNTKIATKYAISVFQEYCQSLHGHANAYLSGAGRFGHTTSSTIIVSATLPVRNENKSWWAKQNKQLTRQLKKIRHKIGKGNYINRNDLFPLVRTTTLGQSVYPDIALHISNYYILLYLMNINKDILAFYWLRFVIWFYFIFHGMTTIFQRSHYLSCDLTLTCRYWPIEKIKMATD